MTHKDQPGIDRGPEDPEVRAAEQFVTHVGIEAGGVEPDPDFPDAQLRVQRVWEGLGEHANDQQVMRLRLEAMNRFQAEAEKKRRSEENRSRFKMVAATCIGAVAMLTIGALVTRVGQTLPTFETGVGVQQVVELSDNSRIALDALTQLSVELNRDARVIHLETGQAQFNVVRDPLRPFRVEAGGHAVVAIGTSFNVEYVDGSLRVSVLEGIVGVMPASAGSPGESVDTRNMTELPAGGQIVIARDGTQAVSNSVDVKDSIAWREGKVVLSNESLAGAISRLNRYSHTRIEVEDAQALELRITGVFEAGNARAFAEATEAYFPLDADYSVAGKILLRRRGGQGNAGTEQ